MTISSTQSAAQRAELDQALIDAAERDDALTAQALLAQGADPNAMCAALPGDEWAATAPRINALMAAAGAGAHAVAELLLRSSANPNAATPKGMTALMRATGAREWEIAALLLAAGADLAAQDCLGFTAFDLIGDEADKGRLLASAERLHLARALRAGFPGGPNGAIPQRGAAPSENRTAARRL